jgi:hypothetical protein
MCVFLRFGGDGSFLMLTIVSDLDSFFTTGVVIGSFFTIEIFGVSAVGVESTLDSFLIEGAFVVGGDSFFTLTSSDECRPFKAAAFLA